MQKTHPSIEKFSRIVIQQRGFAASLNAATESLGLDENYDRFMMIVKQIYDRATRKQSPATPAIIEQLSALLSVDSQKEWGIVRSIKLTIEAFIQKQYDLSSLLADLADPVKFLRSVYAQQVPLDPIKKPEKIQLCDDCEEKSAVLLCEDCGDHFCQDCFNQTHATGNRRAHLTEDIEQLVCVACDKLVAECQCVQCGSFFCDSCFVSTHAARAELHSHVKRVLSGLVCHECEHFNASVLCEDCVDLFCTECFIKIHKKGRRRAHAHLTIDNSGQVFRSGLIVQPEEAQLLIAKAKEEISPWLAFQDDQGVSYWYNLASCQTNYQGPEGGPILSRK